MRIINEKLLKQIRKLPCCVCGSKRNVQAHHHREKGMGCGFRLDIIENISPLCNECHTMKHSSPSQFIDIYGYDAFDRLDRMRNGFNLLDVVRKYG